VGGSGTSKGDTATATRQGRHGNIGTSNGDTATLAQATKAMGKIPEDRSCIMVEQN
jgi:hypothetical protein